MNIKIMPLSREERATNSWPLTSSTSFMKSTCARIRKMENPTSRIFLIALLDLHLKRPKIEITEKKRPTRVVIVGSFHGQDLVPLSIYRKWLILPIGKPPGIFPSQPRPFSHRHRWITRIKEIQIAYPGKCPIL